MNGGNWFVRQFGKVQGPFSWEQLRTMKSQGQLGSFSELSQDQTNWVSITRFPEFTPPPPLKRKPAPAAGSDVTKVGVPAPSQPVAPRPAAQGPLEELDTLPGSSPVQRQAFAPQFTQGATWYYAVEDQQYGPVTLVQLRQMLDRGELHPGDMVWEQGALDWVPLGELTELGGSQPNPMKVVLIIAGIVLLVLVIVGLALIYNSVNK